MSSQYYFKNKDAEICYTKEYFINEMRVDGVVEIEVLKALPCKIEGVFWCKHEAFCGDGTSEYCGKDNCKAYTPRNGKNGCCKYHTRTLYVPGGIETIKLK